MQPEPRIPLPNLAHLMDTAPLSVPPDMAVLQVITAMNPAPATPSDLPVQNRPANDRGVVVVDPSSQPIGLFSAVDVVRVVAEGVDLANTPISAVMQPIVVTGSIEQLSFRSALALLQQHSVTHLPIVDHQGHCIGLLCASAIAQALTQSNLDLPADTDPLPLTSDLQSLYDQAPCGYHSLDAEGRFLQINDTELQMLGYQRDEVIGRSVKDFLTPESLQTFQAGYLEFKAVGYCRDRELQMVRKDGSIFPVSISATAVYDANGQYLKSRSIIIDITERKQLELALKASEAKLTNILDSAITSIVSFYIFADGSWEYDHWSAGCEQLFGYTIAELMADKHLWLSRIYPDDREILRMPLFNELFAEETPTIEYRFCRKDGEIRWFSSTYASKQIDPDRWLITVVNADITDRKQAEIRCSSLAAELQTLYDHAPCGYHSLDADGRILRINDTQLRMMGYSREEVLGHRITDFYPPESVQRFEAAYPSFQQQGQVQGFEVEMVRKDGSILPVSISAIAVYDDQGHYVMSNSVTLDISERVRLEADRQAAQTALQDSELLYRLLCEVSPTGIFRTDVQGRCIYANATTLEITGLLLEESLGDGWGKYLHPDDRAWMYTAWNTFVERCNQGQEATYRVEHRYLYPDDRVRWGFAQAVPERNAAGEVVGFVGSVIDITDLKQAQMALQQRLAREQLIADIAQDIRQSLDLNTVLHRTVERIRRILATDRVIVFQFQPDWQGNVVMESVGSEWLSILSTTITDPCFSDRYIEPYQRGRVCIINDLYGQDLEPCYVELLEHFQVKANLVVPILQGDHLWGLLIAHHCAAPRLWQPEEVELLQQLATQVGIAIQQSELFQQTHRELLERQQMQLALEASEERFRSLSASAPIGICQASADGICLYTNRRWQEMTGMSLEECLGNGWITAIHPDDRPSVLADWERYLHSQADFSREFRILNAQGETRWISAHSAPIQTASGEIIGHVSTKEDITERKQAEAALLESRAQLQRQLAEIETIYQSAPIGLNVLDRDLRFVRINQYLAEMNGLPIEAHLGRTVRDVLPHLADQAEPVLRTILATGEPLLNVEIRGETPAQPGVERIWLEQFWPLKSGDEIIGISTVCEEITERKRLETELQQRERQFATLVENLPDAIVRLDRQLQFLYASSNTGAAAGISADTFIGKRLQDVGFPEELCHIFEAGCEAAFRTGQIQRVECRFQDREYLVRFIPEREANGEILSLIGISEDVTEKKKLEEQFYRAQRMESLGTLASGIAHDLNNVFTPILAIAQLLLMKKPDLDGRSQEMLQVLVDSSKRGANLVKQVLTSIRGFEGNRSPLQVETVLGEVRNIIQQTFPKSIEIHDFIAESTSWPVFADATQLHQVFMNLCINARDAMPDGGILSLRIENRFLDRAYAQMNLDAQEGHYVVITIGDTGTGIPPQILSRIFDPFFTTKEPGKGTGLGLSTVLGIVKNHGGFVQVYSEVGQGTQFRIYLPSIAGTGLHPTEEPEELLQGNGELVLIVDDEILVQQVIRTLLEDCNYTTMIAKDGIEAIATYADHKQEIQAVLLDMMMPNMDGLTTIRTLRRINPQVKIIAASGLPANQKQAIATGAQAFLAKPYTTEDLLSTLHQLINAPPNSSDSPNPPTAP